MLKTGVNMKGAFVKWISVTGFIGIFVFIAYLIHTKVGGFALPLWVCFPVLGGGVGVVKIVDRLGW